MTVEHITKIDTEEEIVLTAPVDGAIRAKQMILEFLMLGIGEEIIIHGGLSEGKPAIVVEFGHRPHIFYTFEARMLADSLEKTMHLFPKFPHNHSVADLIMGLRLGAHGSEAAECQAP